MANEIAQIDNAGSVKAMERFVAEQTEVRSLVAKYINANMAENTDYGTIPGTQNPTLLQPGAEKLTALFQSVAKFEKSTSLENFDTGLFHYEFICRLERMSDGMVISEGRGSCNSYEPRYRLRNAQRLCPNCGKPAVFRSKTPPRDNPNQEPGWYCWAKKEGCGAQFEADDPSITGQQVGTIRVDSDALAGVANTILKMAEKRAHVDAAAKLARRYGFNYTQDMEDSLQPDEPAPAQTRQPPKQQPPAQQTQQPPQQQTQQGPTAEAMKLMLDLIKQAGTEAVKITDFYKVGRLEDLTPAQWNNSLARLRQRIAQLDEEKKKKEAEEEAARQKKAAEEAAKTKPAAANPPQTVGEDEIPWA